MVKKKPIIALFGGSFDPPHKAHETIVETISSYDDIDKLVVMPAFLNPFKNFCTTDAQKRLKWCRQIFKSDKVTVDDYEIMQNRPVYTIETIEHLLVNYVVKYLVIGSDNLDTIKNWKEFDKINNMITWIVFSRDGNKQEYNMLKRYKMVLVDMPISSTNIRNGNDISQVNVSIRSDVEQTIPQKKENNDDQR